MTIDSPPSGYSHTQTAPLCLLVYALAIVFFAIGFFFQDTQPIQWLFPLIGLLMCLLAASFHHLSVVDLGEELAIRFGPVPLFRKTVRYADIVSVEVGKTLPIEGWGIHMSIRGGWV
jgi:hypothetical protein